ncbi:cytochrome c [Oceanibium sediminis]|uniref:cytochrome c n=1 Tax=Oceanibium sediminis TaxID=2026339 RepID=UPI000DD3E29F|nr:cytochrome c [Oceanibium sediminis]
MRRFVLTLVSLAVVGAAGGWAVTAPKVVPPGALPAHTPDAEAGKAVFIAGGCASCHAANGAEGRDMLVLSGGLELKTPFGTFTAPNISPHPEAGIGGWSAAEFVTAMTLGTAPDGRHYYPAFPYTSYARMTPQDLMDLQAYIDTLPPVAERAAGHDLGFPFNIRRAVGLWKMLNLDPDWVLDVGGDPVLARGRALVEGAGHCAECHTPRDAFGGFRNDAWLAGGPDPEGPGEIPNITPHDEGLSWSAADISYYLETGFTPDFDSAGGSMVAVIRNTSQLSAADRDAIAAYLKAVPPQPGG